MTQPQPPGQPYFPQQASAPSAPIPGQPYQTGPVPGQPYPPQAPSESFFGNLFDTSKGFVERFGKAVFIIAVVALIAGWLYSAYTIGEGNYDPETGDRYFSFGEFFVRLLVDAPWVATQMLLIRLFIELVSGATRRPQA